MSNRWELAFGSRAYLSTGGLDEGSVWGADANRPTGPDPSEARTISQITSVTTFERQPDADEGRATPTDPRPPQAELAC